MGQGCDGDNGRQGGTATFTGMTSDGNLNGEVYDPIDSGNYRAVMCIIQLGIRIIDRLSSSAFVGEDGLAWKEGRLGRLRSILLQPAKAVLYIVVRKQKTLDTVHYTTPPPSSSSSSRLPH